MGSLQSFEMPKNWGGQPGKIDAPLNKKLSEVKWGEYRLGDLFEIQNTLSFNADQLTFGTEYDYITRTSLNQGILQETGFVNKENINDAGTWSLGLLQMDFFYRRKPWYAGQFIRKIIPKFEVTESSVLFFTTLLNKQKPKLLSVLVRDVDETFRSINIWIPVLRNGKIDFEFIDVFIAELEAQRIAELEAQRIAELEAHLTVTGLKDYILTEDEHIVLDSYEDWEWKTFNLEDLFGKSTRGKRLKSADRIPGELPFVTAGEADEGISDFIGNDVAIFSENTTTIDMFGSAKYRNYKYGGDDHIAVVHTETLPKLASIFITSAIHKSSHSGQFNYSRNFYAKDADALNIQLPSRGGQPDYECMATFISAVQKIVIKDMILFADRKIGMAKKILNSIHV